MKTPVKFLIHSEDEDNTVFALFPTLKESLNCVLSYAHIGQHSECSLEYARECYEATREQYNDLYHELTSLVGYNLKVLNKA